jgi:hypothetical protein
VISPTVNNAPRPRVVPPEKENDFRAYLKTSSAGIIAIVKASSSDDVGPLENQIIRLANESGWSAYDVGEIHVNGETPQADGLECYLYGGWEVSVARAFKGALKSANLECKYFDTGFQFGGRAWVVDGRPTLVIGRNAQP